jgi:hypothetical protein
VPGRFDLVSAHFVHLPREPRRRLLARLADAVVPGGTLLVVDHDPSDPATTVPRPGLAELGWTAGEVAEVLGPQWSVQVAESRARPATDPEGRPLTASDAVVRARRSTT